MELSVELPSSVRAYDTNREACGGDVLGDDALERCRGVALVLEEADELKAEKIVNAQHGVPVLSKGRLVNWFSGVDEKTPRASIRTIRGEFRYSV